MNGDRDNHIACLNCGTLNVTGVRSCRNCNAAYYYNCPSCHSWVDNTIANCLNCGKKLRWPSVTYYAGNTYIPGKSTSPAAFVLILGSVLLSIVALNLMANNSNPADAVSHAAGVGAQGNIPANELKVTAQPEIQGPYTITATSPAAETDSYTVNDYTDINSAEGPISYEATVATPVTPAPVTETSTSVPKSSPYLDTIYPNWGHCSGGSCRNYYQQ